MPQLGVAIFVVVLANGAFAFVQEHRAERAAERLRDLLPRRATVVRDGRRLEIDAAELVVGDLVLLEAGDRISADLRDRARGGWRVDTSTLTGESVPTAVDVGDEAFAGTFVVEGRGDGDGHGDGAATRLAGIAATDQPRPSGRRLRSPSSSHRVVRTIATIAVGVGGVVLRSSRCCSGCPPRDGFLFAIGVTVALVPEGLLPTVTLSLAIGRAAHGAAPRAGAPARGGRDARLDDVHLHRQDGDADPQRDGRRGGVDAGRHGHGSRAPATSRPATVECDADDGEAARARSRAPPRGARSGRMRELRDGEWLAVGDPMEAALDVLARRLGSTSRAATRRRPSVARFPFDPRRAPRCRS